MKRGDAKSIALGGGFERGRRFVKREGVTPPLGAL